VDVLRWGEALVGQVTDVQENLAVMINSRHPWNIDTSLRSTIKFMKARFTTLNRPGSICSPATNLCLFMQGNPALNTLYPHP